MANPRLSLSVFVKPARVTLGHGCSDDAAMLSETREEVSELASSLGTSAGKRWGGVATACLGQSPRRLVLVNPSLLNSSVTLHWPLPHCPQGTLREEFELCYPQVSRDDLRGS